MIAFMMRPTRARLIGAAVFGGLAFLSRASVGTGPMIALGLVLAGRIFRVAHQAWTARRTAARPGRRRGHARARDRARAERREARRVRAPRLARRRGRRRSWIVPLFVALLIPAVIYVYVNYSKFGTLFSIPWRQQVLTIIDARHREILDENGGHLLRAEVRADHDVPVLPARRAGARPALPVDHVPALLPAHLRGRAVRHPGSVDERRRLDAGVLPLEHRRVHRRSAPTVRPHARCRVPAHPAHRRDRRGRADDRDLLHRTALPRRLRPLPRDRRARRDPGPVPAVRRRAAPPALRGRSHRPHRARDLRPLGQRRARGALRAPLQPEPRHRSHRDARAPAGPRRRWAVRGRPLGRSARAAQPRRHHMDRRRLRLGVLVGRRNLVADPGDHGRRLVPPPRATRRSRARLAAAPRRRHPGERLRGGREAQHRPRLRHGELRPRLPAAGRHVQLARHQHPPAVRARPPQGRHPHGQCAAPRAGDGRRHQLRPRRQGPVGHPVPARSP